jgi:hypothetical protein
MPALLFTRLRNRVWAVKQEGGHLLVWVLPSVDSAVDALGWLLPFDLSRRDLNALALASVTILNGEHITTQHHRNPATPTHPE